MFAKLIFISSLKINNDALANCSKIRYNLQSFAGLSSPSISSLLISNTLDLNGIEIAETTFFPFVLLLLQNINLQYYGRGTGVADVDIVVVVPRDFSHCWLGIRTAFLAHNFNDIKLWASFKAEKLLENTY